jgi:hypothetical protein
MSEENMQIARLASTAVSILLLILSFTKPILARILFSLLFLWAACTNAYTAIDHPMVYLEYADLTPIALYRNFILGFFSEHIRLFVLPIAFAQCMAAIFILYKGILMKLAMAGAILFLLAIAPLGIGSGFPSSVIMAVAVFILLQKKNAHQNILLHWKQKLTNK